VSSLPFGFRFVSLWWSFSSAPNWDLRWNIAPFRFSNGFAFWSSLLSRK
jgi:hypothetical protein